jgi:hypothetical protein
MAHEPESPDETRGPSLRSTHPSLAAPILFDGTQFDSVNGKAWPHGMRDELLSNGARRYALSVLDLGRASMKLFQVSASRILNLLAIVFELVLPAGAGYASSAIG